MTQTLKTTERLGVVDALRGFALLAIVLLHNLEHYNLFLPLLFHQLLQFLQQLFQTQHTAHLNVVHLGA